jgi:long-chain acyl-CoA synthetase
VQPLDPDLARTAARLSRVVERPLEKTGLSLPQYRLLGFLSRGSAAAARLAERLTVTRPTVTAVVDGLVVQGLVARSRTDADRRQVDHALTAEGEAALAEADEAVGTRLAELLSALPDERRDAAVAGLEAWQEALDIERERRLGPT